jgi:chorismate mutase
MTSAPSPLAPAPAVRIEHPTRSTTEAAIAAITPPNEPSNEPANETGTATPNANRPGKPDADPNPAAEVPVPADQAGIDVLRTEIDEIDAALVRLILRRTAVSHAIGTARRSLGGPKIVYSREMAVLERFRDLGPSGSDLGMLLLAMGRGRLGRK